MEILQNILQSSWIYLVVLLPGLSKKLRHEAMDKLIDITRLFEEFGRFLDKGRMERLEPRIHGPIIEYDNLRETFDGIFSSITNNFNTIIQSLQAHANEITRRIEKDDEKRPWVMFGFLFQLGFLFLFGYADIIQLVNNLAPLLGADANAIPPILQNLSISLLMSSIGVTIASGFIIAEFGGLTHFGGWNNLRGKLRTAVQVIVWFAFLSALLIDGILALARIRTIPEVAPVLPPTFSTYILLASAIASTAVIIPMLLVTFLFFQGFVGVPIIYILLIHVLVLGVRFLQLLFVAIVGFFTYGISSLWGLVVKLIIFLAIAFVFIAGGLLLIGGQIISRLLDLGQTLLDIVYSPMDFLIDQLIRRVIGTSSP